MKRLLLLCALAIPCFMACEKMDEVVSPDVEQQQDPVQSYVMRVAEEGIAMLRDAETRAVRRRIDPNRIKPCITTATRSGESDTLYYVVNFADSAGFALVAADSTSPAPLLAVTEQGNYTPGEVTNSGFDDYISLLNERNGGSYDLIIDTTAIGRYYSEWIQEPAVIVDPMLDVNWGGTVSPYNNFRVAVTGVYTSPVGCVNVALAQIMSHYEHPTIIDCNYLTPVQSVPLNWNLIKTHTSSNSCYCIEEIHMAVAQLFEIIAKNMLTNYIGSQADVDFDSLVDLFCAMGYNANDFSIYVWDDVKDDIDAGRVVYMRGEPANSNEADGHAWVVDGYHYQYKVLRTYQQAPGSLKPIFIRDDDYCTRMLHINWGYNGSFNGYFNDGEWRFTDNEGNSKDYRYDVQIITNIRPANN